MRWLRLFRCWWRQYHWFGEHAIAGQLSCRTCRRIIPQASADGRFRIVYWPAK